MSARDKFFDDDDNEEDFRSVIRPAASLDIFENIKRFFERSEIRIASGLILGAIIIGYFAGNIFGSKDLTQTPSQGTAQSQSVNMQSSTSTSLVSTKIKIYITGEINTPGVYELDNKSRLADLLSIAGNTTQNADLSSCNLAGFLSDGMKIEVPTKNQSSTLANCTGQAGTSNIEPGANVSSSSATQTPGSALVNLNTATQSQLEELPGVGPSYAIGIIDYRTKNGGFKSVGDLKKVKGIGEKRYEDLKDLVTV